MLRYRTWQNFSDICTTSVAFVLITLLAVITYKIENFNLLMVSFGLMASAVAWCLKQLEDRNPFQQCLKESPKKSTFDVVR